MDPITIGLISAGVVALVGGIVARRAKRKRARQAGQIMEDVAKATTTALEAKRRKP